MTKYIAKAVSTNYWKPHSNHTEKILNVIKGKVEDGDFIVVSEKAISTALGNMIDEGTIKPVLAARVIARFWMRIFWGYPLGMLCGFGQRLLKRLRDYPLESGGRHKQVALQYAGFWQALMFGSEGGIDGSNLAYSFVSLPLRNADALGQSLQNQIRQRLQKNVCVIIADTDKTYKFRNFFFTPRPNPLKGIHSLGSVSYLIGRFFKFKKSSTPLAVAGCNLSAREALKITNIADKARGPGSGATVWDMAARFKVDINDVSWEMLEAIGHKPIVIIRRYVEKINTVQNKYPLDKKESSLIVTDKNWVCKHIAERRDRIWKKHFRRWMRSLIHVRWQLWEQQKKLIKQVM